MKKMKFSSIIGIFNNSKAKEMTFKVLQHLSEGTKDAIFHIFSDEFNLEDVRYSDLNVCDVGKCENIIACCIHSGYADDEANEDFRRLQGLFERACGVRKVVADAEIFNFDSLERLMQERKNELGEEMLLNTLIDSIDGAYAIAFWNNSEIHVCRDFFGLKPLYFAHFNDCFAFASEREILTDIMNFPHAFELEPRTRLIFNGTRLKFESRSLMKALSEAVRLQSGDNGSDAIRNLTSDDKSVGGRLNGSGLSSDRFASKVSSESGERGRSCESSEEEKAFLRSQLIRLLWESVSRRIPSERFGILFSGGLDSSLIAFLCREICRHQKSKFQSQESQKSQLSHQQNQASTATGSENRCDVFKCYTAVFSSERFKEASDLKYSREVAKELGVKLEVVEVDIEEVERYLRKIVPIVGADVVNVGVALPLFIACERAIEDGVRTLLYGLGSEEMFGGYERHRHAAEVGKLREACISGVENMFRRDTHRDSAISRHLRISLRAPFMTKSIAYFALNCVPDEMKVRKEGDKVRDKVILREIAYHFGLEKAALRKKRAAQYGSNFHKALDKLARKSKMKKRDYLRMFHPNARKRVGCLFSGGKDSTLSLLAMIDAGYVIDCLITVRCENPDAMLFHTAAVEMTELQASAMEIPIITHEIAGENEEDELSGLKEALNKAIHDFKIEYVVSGAIRSEYQKRRIEHVCSELGLKCVFPLWHIDQETEMRICVRNFEMIFTGIAALGLDKSWLGRRINDEDVDRLVEIHKRFKINIAGEGGEFETLVLDSPLFRKKIVINESEIDEIDANTARLIVKSAKLVDK